MHVTYVANSGFVISAGGRRVLVDALFGHWESDWCDVPPLDAVAKATGSGLAITYSS